MAVNKIFPTSPDKYIKQLGTKKAQAALARMAHLNPLIAQINTNTSAIAVLAAAVAALGDLEYNNVIFVDPTYGSNTTGDTEVFGKPYQTIAAAVTAAASGDLIWLRPGAYSVSTNILKDGVHFYCDKGVTITNTGNFFNADTTAGGTTLTAPTFFLGHAVLVDNNAGGGGFCQIRTNPSAVITAEFDSVTSSNISNAMVIRDGLFNFLVRGNFTSAGRCFNFRDTGNLIAEVSGVSTCTFSSNNNAVIYSSGQSWSGSASIKAGAFAMTGAAASQPYIKLDTIVSGEIQVEVKQIIDIDAVTYQAIDLGAGTTRLNLRFICPNLSLTNRKLFSVADKDINLYLDLQTATFVGGTLSDGNVIFLNTSFVNSTASIAVSGTGRLFVPTIASTGTPQDLSGAGAITTTQYHTRWTTTAANAGTLASGQVFGQVKVITMVVDAGDGTLTPASATGFTTVTFNDVGDEIHLMWLGFSWIVIKNIGCTVA